MPKPPKYYEVTLYLVDRPDDDDNSNEYLKPEFIIEQVERHIDLPYGLDFDGKTTIKEVTK